MVFFALVFLLNINTFSQNTHFNRIKSSFNTKPKLLIRLDSKYSFVSNQLINMRGLKAGAGFNDLVNIGIGYGWMKNNFTFDNPTTLINDSTYSLRYSYFSIFGDYNFHTKDNWSFVINADIAITRLGYRSKSSGDLDYLSYGFVLEPNVLSEYRLFKYFVLGSGLGYRFVFRNENYINEKFSAPIFILRFKIDFPLIYEKYLKKN